MRFMTRSVKKSTKSGLLGRCSGFTLLELIVVVSMISILGGVFLKKFTDLLVDVERAAFVQTLGTLRSAVAIQVAGHLGGEEQVALQAMVDSNPMRYLSEKPSNYLGELDNPSLAEVATGQWYFDRNDRYLCYLLRHSDGFSSALPGPARVRLKIVPVFAEEEKHDRLAGVSISTLESFTWFQVIERPWEELSNIPGLQKRPTDGN